MPLAPDVPYEIGDAAFGGYVAGLIDTTRAGSIIASDASQTGLRYMLIVAPASLEHTSKQYKTTNDAAPAAARTRWDGLSATQAMNSSTYPAAQYCAGLTYPSDGGSPWYLGAMDELELIYRNLKATTEANYTTTATSAAGSFPYDGGAVNSGYNPSSDPSGAAYTSTVPGQTSVLAFRDGGGQDLGDAGTNIYYWSATESSAGGAWLQAFSGSNAGHQNFPSKTASGPVRPVRRVLVSDLKAASGTGLAQGAPQLSASGVVAYHFDGVGVISVAHTRSAQGAKSTSGTGLTEQDLLPVVSSGLRASRGAGAIEVEPFVGIFTTGRGDGLLLVTATPLARGSRQTQGDGLLYVTDVPTSTGHKWQRYFTPPGREVYGSGNRFWRRVHIEQGVTVIKRDGGYVSTEWPDDLAIERADAVYFGGYVYPVDDEEHLDLKAAGYDTFYSEDGT